MSMEERNKRLDEAWYDRMLDPFEPKHRPENMPSTEHRLANAAEYAAFQLGRIRVSLEQINASLNKISAKS